MALRDSMRSSAAPYLRPGETIQAVFGGQTLSNWLFGLTGFFIFLAINEYRMFVVTPQRILILDAGKLSMVKAKGVVIELPRATRLGSGTGVWRVAGRRGAHRPDASRNQGSPSRSRPCGCAPGPVSSRSHPVGSRYSGKYA
ncbi:hypothetical protein ACFHYQ_13830 [Sphaerimonospora cavernae]|uniref:PH domain-containing protein n=1 Tax=Sphaerimonospora cavernae TaxID=1740611 RepID=A0ABV6U4H7_9ACTN